MEKEIPDNEKLVAYKSECKLRGKYVALAFTSLATTRAHDISGVFYTALLRELSSEEIDRILNWEKVTKGTVEVSRSELFFLSLIPLLLLIFFFLSPLSPAMHQVSTPDPDDQNPMLAHMIQEGFRPYLKFETELTPDEEASFPGLLRKDGKCYIEVSRSEFLQPGRMVPGAFDWNGYSVTRWMQMPSDFDSPTPVQES